jgi:peptide/nickel transport system ATP-binding protein
MTRSTASEGPLVAERLAVTGLTIALAGDGPDVVSDVSFSLGSGEFLGLVGESGSGKTTTAHALLGYSRRGLQVISGSVKLDGTDLLGLSKQRLREVRGAAVTYVPQDPSAALNPAMSVGRQLRETMLVHGWSPEQISERVPAVLDDVRLEASRRFLARLPHQLSGGQQQRVALAMAFACRPSLIVMDEPTTGLDVSTQRHILDTVRQLCGTYGTAAVYVSHDLAVVAELATSVAVMYAGRIVEVGRASEVFREPLHPYARGLVAAVPNVEKAEVLHGIPGTAPSPGEAAVGCSFATRCQDAIPRCRQEQPEISLIDGRLVRCHRAIELRHHTRTSPAPVVGVVSPVGEPVLAIRDVVASYGGSPVLQRVSFSVPSRSCLALVGESGSGKTTLARCMVGLHEGFDGRISLQGMVLPKSLRLRSQEDLRAIQYIFQNPYTSLNPRKTVQEIIAQPLKQFSSMGGRRRRASAIESLNAVGLASSLADQYPDQLSGGQRQRVAIARALVVQPKVLVCDEVTSALDVSAQAVVVELLRRLQAERDLALVFITHNLALVRNIADRVAVLSQGTVVETGQTSQVLGEPAAEYTRRLIHDIPRFSTDPTSPSH